MNCELWKQDGKSVVADKFPVIRGPRTRHEALSRFEIFWRNVKTQNLNVRHGFV